MKKLFSLILVFCLSTACLLAFTSCDTSSSGDHTFTDEWTCDNDFHWHACTDENCKEIDGKEEHSFDVVEKDGKYFHICLVCSFEIELPDVAEHEHVKTEELSYNNGFHWYACTFENCYYRFENEEHHFLAPEIVQTSDKITRTYKCEHCAYSYVEEITIESIVEGEHDWVDAFENLEYYNYSLNVYFAPDGNFNSPSTYTNSLQFDENACYITYGDYAEYYSVKNNDGTFTTYIRSYSDIFYISSDTSDSRYTGIKNESILDVSFADHYDEFTYDENLGAYVCAGPIEATYFTPNGQPCETLICTNIVVQIADGKIVSIKSDYYFPEERESTQRYKFEYYNIGRTEVVVPQSVINNAIPEDELSDWEEESGSWEDEY